MLGHDAMHEFWFKECMSIHERLTLEMSKCLEETNLLELMTNGKTNLIRKDSPK